MAPSHELQFHPESADSIRRFSPTAVGAGAALATTAALIVISMIGSPAATPADPDGQPAVVDPTATSEAASDLPDGATSDAAIDAPLVADETTVAFEPNRSALLDGRAFDRAVNEAVNAAVSANTGGALMLDGVAFRAAVEDAVIAFGD